MPSDSQLLEGNKVRIGKQIMLPLSKAVEISFRGLRVRFWRSLITMSGIILAIAFLMSVWAGSSVLKGLWQLRDREVMVEVKDESSTFRYEVKLKDGSEEERGAEVVRERAVYNTVAEVLRRKGLQDPRETGAPGGAPGGRIQAVPDATDEAVQSGRRDRWLVILSLCVAVVGIVNSMLMSVTERFREIGTMKCLGALDRFIIKLFLLESAFMGAAGTLIGVVIGLLLTLVSSLFGYWVLRTLLFAALPWGEVAERMVLALVAGTGLSVVGAIYPAMVAARMEPVAALRKDT
jgi:uncharacterized membrane protein YfbV (UPF0208 family)